MAEGPDELIVKIDVNSDEFKAVLDNIAEGFTEQGREIRKLQITTWLLAIAFIVLSLGLIIF